jgi:hypothetical protein
MKRPSPLRRLVPPLIWPIGLLLIAGYWFMERTRAPGRAEAERITHEARSATIEGARAPGVEVVSVGPRTRSVAVVAMDRPRTTSLLIPIIVVVGIGLWIAVLRRPSPRDTAAGGRDGDRGDGAASSG